MRGLFNAPLAIDPACLAPIVADPVLAGELYRAAPGARLVGLSVDPAERPFAFDQAAGVAIIGVRGVLVQRWGWGGGWGVTGYDGIRQGFAAAIADPMVRGIVLDIDSPGGQVSGLFDLVDAMVALRGQKPVHAILSESAYSAAYAIATVADRITVPRTGGSGSVGVIALQIEVSAALEKAGIAVNVIRFGARKAEGNPFEPLGKPARAGLQADIDTLGQLFAATVAANRGRGLTAEAVIGLEAATFLGEAGVGVGLVDAVAAPDAAYQTLISSL